MDAPVGLMLSDDLLFTSKVTAAARSQGLEVRSARSAQVLENLAREHTPRCVIVDLANPGLVLGDLLERLRQTCAPMPRVIAFGSHVDTATLQAAREAGCDLVWPRSKFVQELER